ncbi:MAG: hypothetical protein SGI89_08940 [bacterium]|nr:hypothetical protein [bacterium]
MTDTKLALITIEIIKDQLSDLAQWSVHNDDLLLYNLDDIKEALKWIEETVNRRNDGEDQELKQQQQSIYDYSEADGMAG